jgi:hypothetical protein
MPWQVDFYIEDDVTAPVEEFLDSLPERVRAKALAVIKLLEKEGPRLPFPYSSQVEGQIRELRTQYAKEKIRILYFGDSRRIFILLHGVIKRTEKLNESDKRTAASRMKSHIDRLKRKKK